MSPRTIAIDPADLCQPVAVLLELRLYRGAAAAIAVLALWVLSQVERGQFDPETADRFFTRLDVLLTDHRDGPTLPEALQELIFEGELFHHAGEPEGPDLGQLKQLALEALAELEP